MTDSPAILYGCQLAECGYRTQPSTMGTPYKKCPLCGGPWGANPPDQLKEGTGHKIQQLHGDKKTTTIIVRPHLLSLYDRIKAEKRK